MDLSIKEVLLSIEVDVSVYIIGRVLGVVIVHLFLIESVVAIVVVLGEVQMMIFQGLENKVIIKGGFDVDQEKVL